MSTTDRFKDAQWCKKETILIGGVGGIGSWLALFLSRIGYDIILFDDDKFEEHNMGGQFVNKSSINEPKVKAVRNLALEFGGSGKIEIFNGKYTEKSMSHMYMIAAFDNMEARKVMFENWYKYNKENENLDALFIDGRLLMEQMQIFCVTPFKTKDYKTNYLFDDSEVEEAVCTLKQTSHSAAMIASLMTGFFTNHITNVVNLNKARSVPYRFEYFIPLNFMDYGI